MKRKQEIASVRWDLALRYRLIETVAWWEGRLTTGHLMQSFGISRQQASKDINSYISEYAPKNLEYDKHLKGYVPSRHFKPLFIDDSASAYLHLLNQNYERAGSYRRASPGLCAHRGAGCTGSFSPPAGVAPSAQSLPRGTAAGVRVCVFQHPGR